MGRLFRSLWVLRLTQAVSAGLLLVFVALVLLPTYPVHATDPSSLSVVQSNDSADAGVSGFNINYVEDHGEDYNPDMEEFVATNEWQQVKHGQAVPRGLHIRMNLQTGVKEAKLIDPEEDVASAGEQPAQVSQDEGNQGDDEGLTRLKRMKENLQQAMSELERKQQQGDKLAYWKNGEKEGMMNMDKDTFTKEELKEALKKFKANRDDVQNPDQIRQKYRTMDELKADLEVLNMGMKTDSEILRELLNTYRNESISEEQRLSVLTDLEYHVHQIDNAQDLVDMGGMSLVMKDLNHTNENIRTEAAFVLGSAAQSNPKVQVFMLDTGVIPVLARMLSTERSTTLRNRVLYALSSLLRHFPFAQQTFLQQGGLDALRSVFDKDVGTGKEKLQLKAITLITDLVTEKNLAESHAAEDNSHQKAQQYKRVRLLESLVQHGWCKLVTSLLDVTEHDAREKILNAMVTLSDQCIGTFVYSVQTLRQMRAEYDVLSQEEKLDNSGDLYFTEMLKTLNKLIFVIQSLRDEL